MDTEQAQRAVESVIKNHVVSKAYEKLAKKYVDVEIPKELSLLETLEAFLQSLREESPQNPEKIAEAERQIETTKKTTISGTLVPLKTSDMFVVQGVIAETAMRGREMGFEMDVQLFVMAKAERCATLFLALRQKNNAGERYFKTQEEVLLVDDRVLVELAKAYRDNFVLTDEERKNS